MWIEKTITLLTRKLPSAMNFCDFQWLVDKYILSYTIKNKSRQYLRLQSCPDINFPKDNTGKKYLLYIHIPFCETLCPYCSFNRYLFDPVTAKNYFISLRKELELYRALNYDCSGIYIGGGTPTILLDELQKTVVLAKNLYSIKEISVETNPDHLTPKNIAALKQMGVNRLSVGVQSFDDSILKSIERYQKYGSGQDIKEKLNLAQGNFGTLNVDMIFNFPNQTMEMLGYDLDSILQLGVDQVTFYPLMPGQKALTKLSHNLGRINHDKEKKFYFKILEKLTGNMEPQTAWCFSKKLGLIDEYIVNYDEYIGIGSGSFGFMRGSIFANTFSVEEYINKLGQGKLPLSFSKRFSEKELMRYDFLMRLFGGRLNINELEKKYSGNFCKSLWKEILFFKIAGAIEKKNDFLCLTRKGLYYWVIMMREFFTGVNNFREHCRPWTPFVGSGKIPA